MELSDIQAEGKNREERKEREKNVGHDIINTGVENQLIETGESQKSQNKNSPKNFLLKILLFINNTGVIWCVRVYNLCNVEVSGL